MILPVRLEPTAYFALVLRGACLPKWANHLIKKYILVAYQSFCTTITPLEIYQIALNKIPIMFVFCKSIKILKRIKICRKATYITSCSPWDFTLITQWLVFNSFSCSVKKVNFFKASLMTKPFCKIADLNCEEVMCEPKRTEVHTTNKPTTNKPEVLCCNKSQQTKK